MPGNNTIVFTGGHHNSALATIDWLMANGPKISFIWIGKKFQPKGHDYGPEYTEVSKRGVPFYVIKAGKLYRARSYRYLPHMIYNMFLIPIGFVQALLILRKKRPRLVVSFGGYIALPVVLCAWLLGIDTVTHEQTTVLGLANKIISIFANKIFVSWPKELYVVSTNVEKKMVYTGLPLRLAITSVKRVKTGKENTIYVTGGKTGSLFINELVYMALPRLVAKARIIWQCGQVSGKYGYIGIRSHVKNLGKPYTEKITLKEYFLEQQIGEVFSSADLVITRGGAHTLYELAVMKKPSLIIPIPWSSNNEQYRNARVIEDIGLGKVLDQDVLNPDDLVAEVEDFFANPKKYKMRGKFDISTKGRENLGNEIIKILRAE